MKTKKIIVAIFILSILTIIFNTNVYAAERIAWKGKMAQGKDIYYWVDSANTYKTQITTAVKRLRYPDNMWNPIILTKTSTKSYSKIDLYQYNYDDGQSAYTELYTPKTNGNENILPVSELDSTNWTYSKIYLNYVYMSEKTSDKKSGTILHELCHAYGGKDVYDNKNTIMYGASDRSVTKLTKDFNDVLIEKYDY